MIGNILTRVSSELNAYICRHLGIGPENQKAVLSNVVNQDGSIASQEENIILVSLIDVRQDPATPYVMKAQYQNTEGQNYAVNTMALHVNLYVLFIAYFDSTKARESLNFLTYVLRFFQTKPIFTSHNTTDMPVGVDKLEFTLETINFQEKGYLWGLLGVKYMPFLLYKVRLLSITDNEPDAFIPPIQETVTAVK